MSSVSHAMHASQYLFSHLSGCNARFSFRCRLFLFITGVDPSASDMSCPQCGSQAKAVREKFKVRKESSKILNFNAKFRDVGPVRNIVGTMSLQAHGCWEAGKELDVEGIRDTRASGEPVRPFFRSLASASQSSENRPGGKKTLLVLMWYLQPQAQGSSSVLYHSSCGRRPNSDTGGKAIQKCQAISHHRGTGEG